ncbi:uncharacterized protein [Rutidosis leptorrhynchoides]|uniref:uncharacterized protein n=1 Tax=Rutidosis leptorrhynchoides TaxID=125765 RepID=UPI003A9A1CE7
MEREIDQGVMDSAEVWAFIGDFRYPTIDNDDGNLSRNHNESQAALLSVISTTGDQDPRSRQVGVFPPNIARPLNGVKLLGAPATSDLGFSSELVMQRVTKSIALMDKVAKLDDPQCELLLLRACTGVSKLYFTLRTCPPSIFKAAQRAFDEALRSSLERIVTASGPGFGDWQWRLATLPFAFGGLGVYSAGDVRHYAFLASRLQSAGLQTKLLRHTGNPSEVAAPILMKKLADVYFTKIFIEFNVYLDSSKSSLY